MTCIEYSNINFNDFVINTDLCMLINSEYLKQQVDSIHKLGGEGDNYVILVLVASNICLTFDLII